MRIRPGLKSLILGVGLFFFSLVLPAVIGPSLLWAQTGTITGTVTDPSRATVPGASVKAHNTGTGIDRRLTTNTAGVIE